MILESEIINYSSCTPNKIRCPKNKGYDKYSSLRRPLGKYRLEHLIRSVPCYRYLYDRNFKPYFLADITMPVIFLILAALDTQPEP